MKKIVKVLVLILSVAMLTGCTQTIVDKDNNRVTSEDTGQALTANILCLPKDEKLLAKYNENKETIESTSKYKTNLDNLVPCDEMGAWKKPYDGIWVQLFVQPLSWLIVKVGKIVGNIGISVMLIGLLIRIVLLPFTIKTTKQQEIMKKVQPELDKLEKKYAGKDDQESMMKKSQETMVLYRKYKVNPMASCLITLVQLPIFFAFLEAINRTPAIFENSLWKFQLGTTPLYGITHNNYWYILLLVLIIVFTLLTFMQSMKSTGNSETQKQTKMMMYMMIVFIGIASFQLPSAIALYWVVTNAFSVLQTYIIKKVGK